MTDTDSKDLGMASPATYQITVKGKLASHWMDWFTATAAETEEGDNLHTVLICQVRDQSELLGILNRLNGMNLPLYQVTMVKKSEEKLSNEKL